MHLQPINNTTPNFGASYLRSARIAGGRLKSHENVIDIYSINKDDRDLIEKLMMKIDLKERQDSMAVKEKNTVNSTIRYVLNKALHLDKKSKDGVFIAVKDGKQVTGLLDYTNGESPLLKNLISWHGKDRETSRINLFTEFLRTVDRSNQERGWHEMVDVAAYAEPKTKGNKWLKESGFHAPAQPKSPRERLKMDAALIPGSIREKEALAHEMKIKNDVKIQNVELKDLNI